MDQQPDQAATKTPELPKDVKLRQLVHRIRAAARAAAATHLSVRPQRSDDPTVVRKTEDEA